MRFFKLKSYTDPFSVYWLHVAELGKVCKSGSHAAAGILLLTIIVILCPEKTWHLKLEIIFYITTKKKFQDTDSQFS